MHETINDDRIDDLLTIAANADDETLELTLGQILERSDVDADIDESLRDRTLANLLVKLFRNAGILNSMGPPGQSANASPGNDIEVGSGVLTEGDTGDAGGLRDNASDAFSKGVSASDMTGVQTPDEATLAQQIVANSAEYDSEAAVRKDFPTKKALLTKRNNLQSGGMPGVRFDGVTGNSDDADDIDVSSGVLTE